MSIDTGESDARRTVLSSTEAQAKVFAAHKEKVALVVAELESQQQVKEKLNET